MATAQDKQRIMVTLTTSQVERVDEIAAETGVSRSAVVALALAQWLDGWSLDRGGEGQKISQGTQI